MSTEPNTAPERACAAGLPPLCVATAGSVDDGKSTLIGRLLLDSRAIFADQLEHVERASRRRGLSRADLALVTDGLRAEREQGITIDVAFRYFATARRRFVLADAPGHVQYTRNMAVAASQADVAVVLVDARAGLVEQTRRHLTIARLLGVPAVVVAVNKMDQVGYSLEAFAAIRDAASRFLDELELSIGPASVEAAAAGTRMRLSALPISALHGDNVVELSPRLAWYDGRPLLALLEELPVAREVRETVSGGGRLPVQWVVRPQSESHPDYRGYAGRVAAGVLRQGDEATVLPSGSRSRVRAIETARGPVAEAHAGTSVVVHLADDVDVSRGDWLTTGVPPRTSDVAEADLVWLGDAPERPQARYLLHQGSKTVPVRLVEGLGRYDMATGRREGSRAVGLAPNDIARVSLRAGAPLVLEAGASRALRGFLLVDPASHDTVAAGLLR